VLKSSRAQELKSSVATFFFGKAITTYIDNSSGYDFSTIEQFRELSEEQRLLVYWCDLYDHEDRLLGRAKRNKLTVELYSLQDYYVEVTFPTDEPGEPDIANIEARESLLDQVEELWPEFWSSNVGVEDSRTLLEEQSDRQYQANIIFAAGDYASILHALSSHVTESGLGQIDLDDRIHRAPLSEGWDTSDDKCSAILYPSALDQHTLGSGLRIAVHNTLNLLSKRRALPVPVPAAVYTRLRSVPHIVEVGSSELFHYPADRLKFSLDIARSLQDGGNRSYIHRADNRLFAIKNNPELTDEERIEEIHQHALNFDHHENLRQAESESEKYLGKFWHQLEPETRRFLVTGLHLYRIFQEALPWPLDVSPALVEFSKSIEKEIESKLLQPFRASFQQRKIGSKDLEADLADDHLKRMAEYLASSSARTPEMGTFAHFLSHAINSKKRAQSSVTIREFREFVAQLGDPAFVLEENRLCKTLRMVTQRYRNPAAHTEIMAMGTLQEFFQLLVHGPPEAGFLRGLVAALAPGA